MKKLFLAIAAVAMVFATSCQKENTNAPEEPAVAGENEFICVIDQNASQQNAPAVNDNKGTLAHIDGSNNVWWQEGDEIAYYGTENTQGVGRYVLTCSKLSDNSAYFSAEGKHFYQGTHEAYYPASIMALNGTQKVLTLPDVITIDPDKKAAHLPMYGEGTGSHYLTFHNICAVLKIIIPSNSSSILNGTATRIEISSDKAMNGAFTINNNNTAEMSATSPTSAEKKITVQKSSGSFDNETVYVAIPAQTYASLTIEFFNGNASIWEKTISNATVAVSKVYPITLTAMTHQYVDLGLSVKWATCNIGASKPTDYGEYFSWGATDDQTSYDWGNSAYSNGSNDFNTVSYDKYYLGTSSDNKTVLEPCDDAATAKWGSNWRMPTAADFKELLDNCTQSVYSNAIKFTSIKPGYTDKYIILPLTGFKQNSTTYSQNEWGNYWSSTLSSVDSRFAQHLAIFGNSTNTVVNDQWRCNGFSIRPVWP